MKHFKKRTIALVLASVVTAVGAFGAENYKNSLMALKFSSGINGSVDAVLLTKETFSQTISSRRLDSNTYIIMLPEVNSEVSANIDLGSYIENVDIKTMPYTNYGKGYTKITIKTKNSTLLNVKNDVYIATKSNEPKQITSNEEKKETTSAKPIMMSENSPNNEEVLSNTKSINKTNNITNKDSKRSPRVTPQENSIDINKTIQQFQTQPQASKSKQKVKKEEKPTVLEEERSKSKLNQEILYLILGVVFVISTSLFLMLKARDKLVEITGKRASYDINDEPKSKQKKKRPQKINTTIGNLDKQYVRPISMPVNNYVQPNQTEEESNESIQKVENVVDLDELLNEQQKNSDEKDEDIPVNEALEDFLSSYNFEEEEGEQEEEQEDSDNNNIDEELYNKYINDQNIKFTNDDIEKIETLMSSEISDETMRNVSDFIESSEKEKKPSPREILEKLVTTYTIERDITFTKEDIEALYRLISVEIDNDFITDLRTNPNRLQEMQNEIARQKSKPHKTSELLTLNVKDVLPDLSEALKKQGGRRIESEVKPQVVYFSEGYDVSTLKLNNNDLPDLSKEINNEEAYKSRPSDDIEYVDTSYDVQKMSISSELPDLEDMLKHPEKYETPEPEEVEVDEEVLLKNITNVTFKPFDDGTREFEILNDFGPAPTVSDMQAEFNEIGNNFEIINEEDDIQEIKDSDTNDFETLYDGKYVDLDKDPTANKFSSEGESDIEFAKILNSEFEADDNDELLSELAEVDDNELVNYGSEDNLTIISKENTNEDLKVYPEESKKKKENSNKKETEADKLLNMIENSKIRKEEKSAEKIQKSSSIKKVEIKDIQNPNFCVLEGERYSIVSTSYFTENMGCYLAKNNNGYSIIGFVGDKTFKIKYYEKLNTEKLQSRIAEKLDDETARYIVRIGIHKFLLNVKPDDMEFVMDLC